MKQAQLTIYSSFLEKWTPRLNLVMFIAIGVLLCGIIILSVVILLAAIGSGDGPAPHDAFIEAIKILLDYAASWFGNLLFVAGVVLPIVNVLYLKQCWSAISKGRRVLSLVTLVITGLVLIFIVMSAFVAVVTHLTLNSR